ncbi:MAG: iron-containing alcohol dehydrogenase [Nevskia sp.]|nr:iron-containing alcohol dehydrogenase [Nevskia sp.]
MSKSSIFTQTATERVLIGAPAAQSIAEEAARLGARRVFLLVSASLNRNTDEIAKVKQALGARCAAVFDGVPPHVPRAAVLAAAAQARAVQADLVVSIGGGSVTDCAKILTIALKHGFKTHEDMEPFHIYVEPGGAVRNPDYAAPEVRAICVPTTLSGGEFNPLSGATDERIRIKQGYEQRMMAPVTVILDPAMTVYTPEWLWLSTGVRSLDHAMETLGSLQSNDFCDGMADSALRLLADGLMRVKRDPKDLEGRLRCQQGAWQSMVPLIAGVPMGISHATGHALGGTFNVPHGHTSCVMAPYALAFNAPVNGERQKRIAAALGAPDQAASAAADRFIRGLGMPRSLREVGLAESDLPRLAEAMMHDFWTRTNPRTVESPEQAIAFLKTAL